MTINDALEAFCTELRVGGVPRPLDQPVTLGLLWFDLALIAGEEPPPDVVALLDQPAMWAIGHDGFSFEEAVYYADRRVFLFPHN